eukprot:3515330-Amphidinium_carterae.1
MVSSTKRLWVTMLLTRTTFKDAEDAVIAVETKFEVQAPRPSNSPRPFVKKSLHYLSGRFCAWSLM